jgi:hypothetical protein
MDEADITRALAYNKRCGYAPAEVDFIRKTVGQPSGFEWSPAVVVKVWAWQGSHGLTQDGKVGPKTLAAMHQGEDSVELPVHGVTLGCGLAAYDQTFPGHTPEEAMHVAFRAALDDGCTEFRYWSSEHLIKDIGNKGNSYGEPFLRNVCLPAEVRVGVWADDPTSALRSSEYARRLAGMQIRVASLMMNRSNTYPHDPPWHMKFTTAEMRFISENLDKHGIERTLTAWPRPSKEQIDTMCEDMAHFMVLTGATLFEVDAESNWDPKFLSGFSSMREAARYLAQGMRDAAGPGKKIGMTTFTYHVENSSAAKLAPFMDVLFPQAYAVRNRSHGTVEWDDLLGPARHPGFALKRARQAAAA